MRWYNGWDGVNDVDDGLLLWLQMVIYMMIFIVPRTYVYIYIYIWGPCLVSGRVIPVSYRQKKTSSWGSKEIQDSTFSMSSAIDINSCTSWTEICSMWFLKNGNDMSEDGDEKMLHTMTVQVPKSSDFSHSFGTYESATRVTVIFDTLAIKRSKKTSCISLHWTHIKKKKNFPTCGPHPLGLTWHHRNGGLKQTNQKKKKTRFC